MRDMKPLDIFPHVIGLKFAIQEILDELAVDTIQENPRLVLMALRGLLAQTEELTSMIQKEATQ